MNLCWKRSHTNYVHVFFMDWRIQVADAHVKQDSIFLPVPAHNR